MGIVWGRWEHWGQCYGQTVLARPVALMTRFRWHGANARGAALRPRRPSSSFSKPLLQSHPHLSHWWQRSK
jgi:hypothetical protein